MSAKRSSIQTIETQLREGPASLQSAQAQLQQEAASLAHQRDVVDSQHRTLDEERALKVNEFAQKQREFLELRCQQRFIDSTYADGLQQLKTQTCQLQQHRAQVLSRVDQIASEHEVNKKLLQSSLAQSRVEVAVVEASIAAELSRMNTSIAGILASAEDHSKVKKARALKKAEVAALEAKRAAEECEAEDAEIARLQALMCVP